LGTLTVGCAEIGNDDDMAEDTILTTASQAIGTEPPIHHPQLCNLPVGRYILTARATTMPGAYNVQFFNDAVPGSRPSTGCKTMSLVWNEATAPVPPQQPPDDQLHTKVLEGWWVPTPAGSARFAVKAVHQTSGGAGVVTGVNGVAAYAYAIMTCDLAVSCNQRLDWIGAGSDANHRFPVPWPIPGQFFTPGFPKDWTIAITGPHLDATNRFLVPVQFVYLASGSARDWFNDVVVTRPCISGPNYVCPPVAP